jgi:LytS/YehU family sensor histidine kinase
MLYYVLIYYRTNKENLIRKTEMASTLNEMELANLKSQINPHFLFNSLNSISYQIIENPEEARESLVKLSDYFRYSLTRSADTFSSLKDELDNVFRYLEVEKIRFGEKMKIEKTIDDQCYEYPIPVMLLQPLFENCVKHGVYESSEPVTIRLEVNDQPDHFTILISNNIDPEAKARKGTSTGLSNVDRRLKLIYKRNDLLDIEKTKNFFSVRIRIPKNKAT